jgi:hypothetical protein
MNSEAEMINNAGRAAIVMEGANKVDLVERKKKNEAWMRAFKKTHGIKKQSVLPSATTQHNEWAIKEGWSMMDANTWRSICEKAKFATDDTEGEGILCLISETIAMAGHCDAHPIALIHLARTQYERKVWDLDALDYMKEHMLHDASVPNTPEHAVESSVPSAPRKRRMIEDQASQPFSLSDDDVIRD